MLLQTGCDRENVWVEDDVARWEIGLFGQQCVSARADVDLALEIIGLALLIERHHNDRCAITPNQSRLSQKFPFAVLQANGVDDRFALDAFEAGLNHPPHSAVDYNRNSRDVR